MKRHNETLPEVSADYTTFPDIPGQQQQQQPQNHSLPLTGQKLVTWFSLTTMKDGKRSHFIQGAYLSAQNQGNTYQKAMRLSG